MKYKALSLPLLFCLFYQFSPLAPIYAEDIAYIDSFSPQWTVKSVRQVSVRFSEQMVPLGDPRLVEPFEINCQEKGRGRWADGRNWIYDFHRDIPAGIICEFKVKEGLKTLSGKEITGQRVFMFSTGGPAVRQSRPWEGSENIDEDQIFILTLDAEPDEESVLSNVSFSIEGIKERVGARIIKGEERERLLKNIRRDDRFKDMPVIVLQCRQRFPNNARVNLIWGKGVASLSGVPTAEDQVLPFRAREPFAVSFSCERENPRANCIPMLPMTLGFSAPVSWDYAGKVVMRGPENKIYKPSKGFNGDGKEAFVNSLSFIGPFPENSTFVIEMPKDIKDDAGRSLSNINSFPLTVKTDSYPPLAKFSSRFGIIELNGDAALPVTLRNLEPRVKSRILDVGEEVPEQKEEGVSGSLKKGTAKIGEIFSPMLSGEMKEKLDTLKGRSRKVFKDEEIIDWLKKVAGAGRRSSILTGAKGSTDFYVPKPSGTRAFEVVGIPLKDPGLYVVEMESLILGSSLLGVPKPMYVPTAALVTNLSAHFKWGRESSLVWVTTLNKGEPVKDAAITIRDCEKKVIWQGKTDAKGIAYVNSQLPMPESLPYCQIKWEEDHYYDSSQSGALNGIGSGLFVFAKTQDDMTFAHSSWDNGIEPWRFSLPHDSYRDAVIAHTVFDHPLLRAGETVSMKHIIRRHVMDGFSFIKGEELPKAVLIQHRGSNQRYEFPLKWDGNGIAETSWKIPQEAKLGTYEVTLLKKATERPKERTAVGGYEEGDEGYFYPDGWPSGSFRVEEFRVPLMKGIIQPPKEPLINASEAHVDLFVKYLSGGGAGGAAVKLRSQVQPRYVNFDEYEGFVFANGEVKEEAVRSSSGEEWYGERESGRAKPKVQSSELILDPTGALRTKITGLPKVATPQDIQTELEFKDPNGEVQTVSTRIPLWPSRLLVGIKPDAWAASKEAFKFHVAVVNTAGRPVKDSLVKVDLFERKYYSHRKRLVGGFYSYEHVTETRRIGGMCEGKTNPKGVLTCEAQSPVSGNVILQATAADDSGNVSTAFRDVWIAGKGEWWFDVTDNDRIDILPEKKRYEPGETARFQVRMPFRDATALVTVEREGVMERFVKRLSGKNPTIDRPIKSNYAPNVFVSVLCVRGRVSGVQPTSLVDLGKQAYKLGIAEIKVGWRAHELKVKVASERSVYKIREKARVKVSVKKADGTVPPKGSEVAIAAVDEGLLELMPNNSWKLLDAMMGRRGYEVRTATAQMQVVGKRHYGLKALPHGGGGGRQTTREMFDTLLLWKGRVFLDEKGEATVEIPLNDSLTSFKIVAVASGGVGLFGTGETSIRTTQDLMLLSGLPQMVREGDRFRGGFTIRNASDRKMDVEVTATLSIDNPLEKIVETFAPGEAKEVGWDVTVPVGIDSLTWQVSVKEKDGAGSDRMKVRQKVAAAVPVRTFQATITQVDKPVTMKVEKPTDALPSKGGVNVSLRSKLSNGLGGVTYFMKNYPYTCMEQKVSRAVALRDEELWKKSMAELPSHMDSDGLIKYFPTCIWGSDTLTAYILAIANEAGWEIPEAVRARMEEGLIGFINGRVIRWSSLPTADVSIRKMAALEALSRYGKGDPGLLGSITLEPNLWPTSAVIDWMNVLMRVKTIPDRQKRLKEAEQIIRSRLNFQGTGRPWATIQSLAAIPLKDAFSSGYKIKKSLTPVEQKKKGKWSKGDVVRVRLELESQADMTWVVVNDPVPAGSSILGTGLGRDSQILTGDERSEGWVWPAFEERSFEAFRAYYEFVPKGKWTVEYTVRLNNEGTFNLPETRVEALYAPEMFGEIPNRRMEVER